MSKKYTFEVVGAIVGIAILAGFLIVLLLKFMPAGPVTAPPSPTTFPSAIPTPTPIPVLPKTIKTGVVTGKIIIQLDSVTTGNVTLKILEENGRSEFSAPITRTITGGVADFDGRELLPSFPWDESLPINVRSDILVESGTQTLHFQADMDFAWGAIFKITKDGGGRLILDTEGTSFYPLVAKDAESEPDIASSLHIL